MEHKPYTVPELAERWSCPEQDIRNAINRDVLPVFRLGRMIRVPADKVTDEMRDRCVGLTSPRLPTALGRKLRAVILAHPEENSRVYFFRSGKFVKVGYATHVGTRLSALVSSSPVDDTELLGSLPGGSCAEREAHKILKDYRHRHEWFCLTDTLRRAILEACA
jgi:hypothetical protein